MNTRVRVAKVSAAKEFETFRSLPKYNHVSLAVINPSPIKKRPRQDEKEIEFELMTSPFKLEYRKNLKPLIPEHLARPTVEVAPVPVAKKNVPKNGMMLNEKGKPMTWKEKKDHQEKMKQQEIEEKKIAKGRRCMKLFFMGIKEKLLDNKSDEDPLSEQMLSTTVGKAKDLIKDK